MEHHLRKQKVGVMEEEDVAEGLRLLLIGKTGCGKSATGNTIFGESVFESKISSSPVTRVYKTHTGAVDNRSVTVVDTPDSIFSTDSVTEMKRALQSCAPGAHVILLILSLRTFTEQEMEFVSLFERWFGAEVLKFTLVLFTHAENLNSDKLSALIRRNGHLSGFINRCRGRFCGINNKDRSNRRQVMELMLKVERLVSENRNSCYTLQMMEEAERRRREEEERKKEEKRREEEEREREHQMTLERVRQETEKRARRECEEERRAKKLEEHRNNMKKCIYAVLFCASMSGVVSVWKTDSLHLQALFKGFITGGSAAAAGVFTGILWRLMWKSQFSCSTSHERPSAVTQLLLKKAGVGLGGVLTGAVMHQFVKGNLLPSMCSGAVGALIVMCFLNTQ